MRLTALVVAAAITGATLSAQQGTARVPAKHYTYVIVHGAWGGGWDWRAIDSMLTRHGHRVVRVTLTGLGERHHLASPNIGLDTHIDDVVNTILWDNLHDVVLLGHSYGGMVITGVVDRIPDRIKRVIYLDALLPDSGESVMSIPDTARQKFVQSVTRDGYLVPVWVQDTTVTVKLLVFAALQNLIRNEGAASLIATHNHDLARRADRIVTLREGLVEPLTL